MRRFFLLFIIFSGQNFTLLGQLDSLLALYKTSAPDTNRVLLASKIGKLYQDMQSNTDSALYYLNEGIRLGEKIGFISGVVQNLYTRANIEQYNLSDEPLALTTYARALALSEQIKDERRIGRIAYGMAVLHDHQKSDENFLIFAHKGRLISQKTQDHNNYIAILTALGAFHFARKQNDSAEIYLKEAYTFSRKNKVNPNYMVYSILGLAEFYNETNRKENALRYFRELIVKANEVDDKLALLSAYNSIAKLQIEQKQYLTALNMTGEVLKMRSDSTSYIQETMADALKIQALAYEKMGLFNDALARLRESVRLTDSLNEANRGNEVNLKTLKIQTKSDLDRKQKEVEIQQLRTRIAAVAIFFSVIVVGLLLINAWRIRKRNQLLAEQKEQLEAQKKELEYLNGTKDKLFSTISHDLRAPLSSLNGLLSLWNIKAVSPERFEQISQNVKYNLSALSNTLDNLLQWAYTQMRGIKSKPETFDFQQIIKTELTLLAEVANAKSIHIEQTQTTDDTTIVADKNQIAIVFRNIIANAIKYSPVNSIVSVKLSAETNFLHVSISDKGVGMAPALVEAVLNHQYVESKRGTADEKGTGLGLWLCKDFLEANRGRLLIESTEMVGTTMILLIPRTA